MNHIFGRKQFAPREINSADIVFDARPPSPEAAVERLQRAIRDMPPPEQQTIECDYGHRCWNPRCLEAGNCVGGLKPESEVMPNALQPAHEAVGAEQHDAWPPSATGADRINPFDEIAALMRTLTWREMMDLSEAWNTPADTLWKWSKEREYEG